jgi:hypothetical protein
VHVCTHRKSLSFSMLSYSTMGMSISILVGVHQHRPARWYKTNSHKMIWNFS